MAILKKSGVKHFLLTQLLCFLIHLIVVALFKYDGINIIHFYYITPAIVLLMMIMYFIFWRTEKECNECFFICCSVSGVLALILFLSIFYPLYYLTLKYELIRVEECQVIGLMKTFIPGIEQYQMLYVDFKMNDQNMLGYACMSSNYDDVVTTSTILYPNRFYNYGDSYYCGTRAVGTSYILENERVLYSKRNRITNYNNIKKKRYYTSEGRQRLCNELYTFSQVKLPGWMCLPPDVDYSDLTQNKNCYVHFYKGQSENSEEAILNSKNRKDLKQVNQFAIISFNGLFAPLGQYMSLLVLAYCPMIVSINIFLAPLCFYLIKVISQAQQQILKFRPASRLLRQYIRINKQKD